MAMLLVSIVALASAVHRNRLAEVDRVKTNVDSLRTVLLAREASMGDRPRACGTRAVAETSFDAGTISRVLMPVLARVLVRCNTRGQSTFYLGGTLYCSGLAT